jgi:chemotaxis protein histidine kinase CheA/ActR/RegA family two-component response regulator
VKLNDLIEALASEVEMAQPRLAENLSMLATLNIEDPVFIDSLGDYSGQWQRMGEAAEMACFEGLQAVCMHVVENLLALATLDIQERSALVEFLEPWPRMIVAYLRNIDDRSQAAGLVDHMVRAPYALEAEQALKIMHMLGSLPAQLQPSHGGDAQRPVLATQADVDLQVPQDADSGMLAGFISEAPDQAHTIVALARKMVDGHADTDDLVLAKRLVHTLKGSGAIIGLRGLATLSHQFEDILEHFEHAGGRVARSAADALLDAAYCLEQMVGYVAGSDECPTNGRAVLQAVLDVANRIDRGDSLEVEIRRDVGAESAPKSRGESAPGDKPAAGAGANVLPGTALRVSTERVNELFRLSGEVSVHGAAMEARIKALVDRTRDLLAQNLRVQKRLFELETLVDVRALTTMRARTQRMADDSFDPLEMDPYNELHGATHALMEEAADARALSLRLEEDLASLGSVHTRQQRLGKELQHVVIGTRMSEASTLESRLQRNVRSTCQATGKEASLLVLGGDTQIDSDVLNRLADPLLHLMRNAVDHGLETPEVRVASGKEQAGRIELSFSRQGQLVVLRCTDDGAGLDLPAIHARAIARGLVAAGQALEDDAVARLILLPGFSTRESVTEVSGRGIGLDVVRDWVNRMNGSIRITTNPGRGCTFELRFAASLSTQHSLIVEVSGQLFALPSLQVEQAVARGLGSFAEQGSLLVYRDGKRTMPARRLCELVGRAPPEQKTLDDHDVVIVRHEDGVQALAVDRLLDSRELLVKLAGRFGRHIMGVAGLSILGDGTVAVNLDIAQLMATGAIHRTVDSMQESSQETERVQRQTQVLIVDDALSMRTSLLQLMEDSGFQAEAARDGLHAVDALKTFRPDIVLTDLEMPNMNGVEFTMHLRGRDDLKDLPIIMITSRSQEKHRRMAQKAGVDHYLTKPYNDVELLTVMREALAAT